MFEMNLSNWELIEILIKRKVLNRLIRKSNKNLIKSSD